MGRKILTGRFNTRCELVRQVLFLYYQTGCNMSQIGRNVQISQGLVSKLIDEYSRLKNVTIKCKGERK